MIEHETTELLKRLVSPLEPGEPPVRDLLKRGRHARGRRRAMAIAVVAAAVAAVVGGTTVLADQVPRGSGGTTQNPQPEDGLSAERELDLRVAYGSWAPREILGVPVGAEAAQRTLMIRPQFDGLLPSADGLSVSASVEHCQSISVRYDVGTHGELAWIDGADGIGLCEAPGADDPPAVAHDKVLVNARVVQVVDGVLTLYGDSGEVLGVYDRVWNELDAADLVGAWRPVTMFSGASVTIDELEDSLDREALRRRAWVTFFGDRYEADDGINITAGRYEVGLHGEFRDWDQRTTLVGCITVQPRDDDSSASPPVEPMPVVPPTNPATAGDGCQTVPNAEIVDSAARVQRYRDLLVFYDGEARAIGVFLVVPTR